jgi:hypothetical protein
MYKFRFFSRVRIDYQPSFTILFVSAKLLIFANLFRTNIRNAAGIASSSNLLSSGYRRLFPWG